MDVRVTDLKGFGLDDVFTDMVQRNHRNNVRLQERRRAEKMASIRDAVVVCVVTILVVFFGALADEVCEGSDNKRTEIATVEANVENTYLLTRDGERWEVVNRPDIEAKKGTDAEFEIKFETKGTTRLNDDEIILITPLTN